MSFGIELLLRNIAGQSGMVCRQRGGRNDPGRHRKQIWLRYAGIGSWYGLKQPWWRL